VNVDRAQIAIVGDFNPSNPTHQLTNAALEHVDLDFTWLPTDSPGDWEDRLTAYDGVCIAPASHRSVRRPGGGSLRARAGSPAGRHLRGLSARDRRVRA
jgi:hypothetical protein